MWQATADPGLALVQVEVLHGERKAGRGHCEPVGVKHRSRSERTTDRPIYLHNTSSRFKSSLQSIVHAANSPGGSLASVGRSPTSVSFLASAGLAA